MPTAPITLELERPSTLASLACGPLATWFVALLVARGRSVGSPRSVARAELRERLRTDGAYPMALSRLFATARAAGLEVGWGDAVGGDVSSCDPGRRGDGPFWITRATARAVRITCGGVTIDAAGLRRWLQSRATAARASVTDPDPIDGAGPARFWFDLLLARQQTEEDGSLAPAASTARRRPPVQPLAALAAAAAQPLQRGWALFALARQARRRDDVAAARAALQQALESVRSASDPRSVALHRLCSLGLAWCAYQARDVPAAQRLLDRTFFNGSASWRDNPRLCAEVLNLRGLLRRTRLAARWPRGPADDDVADVLGDFEAALVAAIEADAFTLMEGVASNLGYSIWLLRVAPGAAGDALAADARRLDAMRWILLSEWYRQRHALSGQSLWNVLSVCRIARGGLALGNADDAPAAERWAALPLAVVRRELAPLGDLLHAGDATAAWPDVTSRLLDELQAAPTAHGRLETAAVMLEHLWQLAPMGATSAALDLSRELRRRVASLAAADQVMFTRELARIEAPWMLSSPTMPAARPTRSSRRRA